ncbi:MAG: hypothetical protein NZL93_01395, partial [Chthoniobacterales bacterium]|nr:hypothetical protein [Chthoniobacterales bacterium]
CGRLDDLGKIREDQEWKSFGDCRGYATATSTNARTAVLAEVERSECNAGYICGCRGVFTACSAWG